MEGGKRGRISPAAWGGVLVVGEAGERMGGEGFGRRARLGWESRERRIGVAFL